MADRFDDWYDYLNPVKYAQAGYDYFIGDPANQVKAAYDRAAQQANANSAGIRDFLMGRLGQAQKFYQPMQEMFNQTYGTQGVQAPQVPNTPGVNPLNKMFGGMNAVR